VTALLWRMPSTNEPHAQLSDVTIAEVAEALEAPSRMQLRQFIGKDMLVVYSVTTERRALIVLLVRFDDSFVWRVAAAKPMSGAEFQIWFERNSDE
jgi:hypothetical protein